MYEFSSVYPSVMKISMLAGFWNSLNPSEASKRFKQFYALYSVVSILPVLYTFVCNSIAAVTVETDNTRMIAVNFGTPLLLFDVVNILLRNDRLYSLITDLDAIVKTLTEDELFKTGSNDHAFHKVTRVNLFFNYYLIPYMACPILTIIYIWACHFIFGSTDLIYTVPYDIHCFPFLYELTLFTQTLSALYASSKCVAAEGLYFCLLFHLCSCLKQLRASSKFIFLEASELTGHTISVYKPCPSPDQMRVLENTLNMSRFKTWIKIHNEIIRLIHELKAFYSIRLGLALLGTFGVGLFMVYSAVMESHILLDSLVSFVSWVTILTIQFAPCSYGTHLTYQNSVLLEDIYDKVSGCGNMEIQMCALITGEVVKKPLHITVYGCTYFDLSLDTFLWMLKTVASFYVTLLQMKNVQMI